MGPRCKSSPAPAACSGCCRCLQTADRVLEGLGLSAVHVEELCRETLGSDYCDARHSVSDPPDGHPSKGPCDFQHGLNSTYPQYSFPGAGLGAQLGWWGPQGAMLQGMRQVGGETAAHVRLAHDGRIPGAYDMRGVPWGLCRAVLSLCWMAHCSVGSTGANCLLATCQVD